MNKIDIEAVLTSTHNLCFKAKLEYNVYPCITQFYYIKVRCMGVYSTQICKYDGTDNCYQFSIEHVLWVLISIARRGDSYVYMESKIFLLIIILTHF